MRVFVTGASGHIASSVIPELLSAGHAVTGLARSERAAAAVEGLGAGVRRGDLDDLDGLSAAARAADGVIHLAFKHEEQRTSSRITRDALGWPPARPGPLSDLSDLDAARDLAATA